MFPIVPEWFKFYIRTQPGSRVPTVKRGDTGLHAWAGIYRLSLIQSFFLHDAVQPAQHGKDDKGSQHQQCKVHPEEIGFVFVPVPQGGQEAGEFITNGGGYKPAAHHQGGNADRT